MRAARWSVLAAASVLVLVGASRGRGGPQATATPPGKVAGLPEIQVPEGNGAPVITDGLFTPGEWDDSSRQVLGPTVELRVKQYRGVVFLGVRGANGATIGPSELSVALPGGAIHLLHVSAQLGEVVLPATGAAPPFRFGLTPDWYANELRRDQEEAERLQKEGKSPMEIIAATSYPSDGIEFAIRRSKLQGPRWLIRLGVSAMAEGKPGWLVYPAESGDRKTEGWQVLRLD